MKNNIGFRFDPTEEEIIMLLSMKVRGEALPHNAIGEVNLYERMPWELFNETSKESFYVFTKVKSKTNKSKKLERTVGSLGEGGTWKGQNNKEMIDDGGQLIGYNRAFVFQNSKKRSRSSLHLDDENLHGHWIMHEYSLAQNSPYKYLKTVEEYVVCKIKNKKAARNPAKPERNFKHYVTPHSTPATVSFDPSVKEGAHQNLATNGTFKNGESTLTVDNAYHEEMLQPTVDQQLTNGDSVYFVDHEETISYFVELYNSVYSTSITANCEQIVNQDVNQHLPKDDAVNIGNYGGELDNEPIQSIENFEDTLNIEDNEENFTLDYDSEMDEFVVRTMDDTSDIFLNQQKR